MLKNLKYIAFLSSSCYIHTQNFKKKLQSYNDLNELNKKQIIKTKTDTFIWGNGIINNTYVYLNFHPHRIKNFLQINNNLNNKTVNTNIETLSNNIIDISFNEYLSAAIDNSFNLYIFKEPKLNAEKVKTQNNHIRENVKQLLVKEKFKVIQAKFTKDKLFLLTKDNKVYFYNIEIIHPKIDEFFVTALPEPEIIIDENKLIHVKELKNIVQIECGKDHFVALDNKGNVFGMGDDSFGQLGQGNFTKEREFQMKIYNNFIERRERTPVSIPIPEKVVKLACGDNHTLALTATSNVYGFGYNRFLQLSNDALYRKQVLGLNSPTIIPLDKFKNNKVVDIACSKNCSFFTCLNENDKTYYFFSAGEGLRGTLGQNLTMHLGDIEVMPDISGLVNADSLKPFEPMKLVCGNNHCLLLFKSPRIIYTWGDNEYGELGTKDRVFYESPIPILEEYNLPYKILNISAGFRSSAFICEKADKIKKNEILEKDKAMYEEEKKKRRRKRKDFDDNDKNDKRNHQDIKEDVKDDSILSKVYKNIRKYI